MDSLNTRADMPGGTVMAHTRTVPPRWDIRLLGAFDMRAEGSPLPVPESARARSLLGYLLVHRDSAVPRERLAAALWPESTESQARTNLRHLLHTLRRASPGLAGRLVTSPTTLGWWSAPGDRMDLTEFDRLAAATGPDRPAALRAAAGIYRGELLPGFDDQWVRPERDAVHRRFLEVLHELAESTAEHGDLAAAVADTERLLQLDPLRESGYRLLMRLLVARGDRSAAVRVFHRCSRVLDRELDVRPGPETEAVYRSLLPGLAATEPGTGGRRPPLVGRDRERATLTGAWRESRTGRSRLLVLTGAPGTGKSRLAIDFRAWAARQGASCATAACYAAEGPLPYGVVTAWLRSPALRPVLGDLPRPARRELARLLPELLADDPRLEPPAPLAEDEQRPRVFDAVVTVFDLISGTDDTAERAGAVPKPGLVGATAPGPPLLLVVDDLHHADRESCRLVHYLLRTRPAGRLLVVATARHDELGGAPAGELLAAGRHLGRLTRIELDALDQAETRSLAERMGGAELTDQAAIRLHRQTGGNPLFVVEAIRAGWSAAATRVPVTPRVQAVLESRIAGLSPIGRELAVSGAVIGRPFDADLLFEVTRGPAPAADDLVVALDELWRRGIVADHGAGRAGQYDFTHEALRSVALAETGPAQQASLHRRVGRALVRRRATIGSGSAEIAGHLSAGGEPVEAADWYLRAARSANLLHAHVEAITLLERALDAVAGRATDDDPAVDRPGVTAAVELDLLLALLGPLVSEHGYAAPDVAAVQRRATRLTDRLGRAPSAPLLRSLAMTALTADDFTAAQDFGRRLLATASDERTAPEAGDAALLRVEAGVLLGFAAFWSADFVGARACFEQAVADYRPANTAAHLAGYGQDPKAVALARLANTNWFLGDPAGAVRAREEAIAWAEHVRHPYTRAAVLLFGALLGLDMDDGAATRRCATALADLAPVAPPLRQVAGALGGYMTRRSAGMPPRPPVVPARRACGRSWPGSSWPPA